MSENDSSGHAPNSTGISSIDPTRKVELDSMVEVVDWTGVSTFRVYVLHAQTSTKLEIGYTRSELN